MVGAKMNWYHWTLPCHVCHPVLLYSPNLGFVLWRWCANALSLAGLIEEVQDSSKTPQLSSFISSFRVAFSMQPLASFLNPQLLVSTRARAPFKWHCIPNFISSSFQAFKTLHMQQNSQAFSKLRTKWMKTTKKMFWLWVLIFFFNPDILWFLYFWI